MFYDVLFVESYEWKLINSLDGTARRIWDKE